MTGGTLGSMGITISGLHFKQGRGSARSLFSSSISQQRPGGLERWTSLAMPHSLYYLLRGRGEVLRGCSERGGAVNIVQHMVREHSEPRAPGNVPPRALSWSSVTGTGRSWRSFLRRDAELQLRSLPSAGGRLDGFDPLCALLGGGGLQEVMHLISSDDLEEVLCVTLLAMWAALH